MMIVVVPKVTSIFESMDQALPWYTQLLIGTSHLIASNEMLGFVLSVVTFTLTRTALRDYKPTERAKQHGLRGRWRSGRAFSSCSARSASTRSGSMPLGVDGRRASRESGSLG